MGGRISGESAFRRSRRVIPVPQPSAGTDWTLTVPAGHVYRLEAVRFRMVNDATAVSRYVALVITDGNAEAVRSVLPSNTAANDDVVVSYWRDAAALLAFDALTAPLPIVDLQAGWTIGSSTLNLSGADQFSAIRVTVLDVTVRGGPADLSEVPDLFLSVGGTDDE